MRSWSVARKPQLLDDAQRATILTLLAEGATLAEVFTIRGITSYSDFYATRNADEGFDAAVRGAMAQGAEAAIAEAAEVGKAASTSGDPDLMRIAEAFHRCALAYAEKTAPREYGHLIKLSNPDGGPLTLHVVNYALPTIESKLPLKTIEGPSMPAIEGHYEELDPT